MTWAYILSGSIDHDHTCKQDYINRSMILSINAHGKFSTVPIRGLSSTHKICKSAITVGLTDLYIKDSDIPVVDNLTDINRIEPQFC